MEKKIVYIACDGKEFSTERACAEYELSINIRRFEKDFSLYDRCKTPIPHNTTWNDEDIFFMRIINPSEELNMYLNERFKDYGIISPWKNYDLEFKDDLYYWDIPCECWRSWSGEMERLELMGEYFQMFTEN